MFALFPFYVNKGQSNQNKTLICSLHGNEKSLTYDSKTSSFASRSRNFKWAKSLYKYLECEYHDGRRGRTERHEKLQPVWDNQFGTGIFFEETSLSKKKPVWLTRSHSPCSHQMPFHCWTLKLSNVASSRVMSVARLRTAYFYLPLIPAIVSSWGEPIIWATLTHQNTFPKALQ